MIVYAVENNRFGVAEDAVTARLPVMLRPSPPRFLSAGDKYSQSFVVENMTEENVEVKVAMRAANVEVIGPSAKTLTVPANDRAEVLFNAVASSTPGEAVVQGLALCGAHSDAAKISFPIKVTMDTFPLSLSVPPPPH